MLRPVLTSWAIFSASALQAAPVLAKPQVLAVFQIEDQRPTPMNAKTAGSLTNYLATLLAQKPDRFKVVPQTDLARALRDQKRESLQECFDENCQIELGKAVAAERSLSTRISKLGSRCVITSTLFDLTAETTERAASFKGQCTEDDFTAGIESIVKILSGEAPAAKVEAPPPPKSAQPKAAPKPEQKTPVDKTRLAFGGSNDDWMLMKKVSKERLTEPQYLDFMGSGLAYSAWAERYNDRSESWFLEISKWLFTGLSVASLIVAAVDSDAVSSGVFWGASAAAGFVPAITTWTIDLINVGDVPKRLR